jgi:hypothetical protein
MISILDGRIGRPGGFPNWWKMPQPGMNKVAARLSTDTDAEAVVRKYGAPSPEDAAEAQDFDDTVADAMQQLPARMPAGGRQ